MSGTVKVLQAQQKNPNFYYQHEWGSAEWSDWSWWNWNDNAPTQGAYFRREVDPSSKEEKPVSDSDMKAETLDACQEDCSGQPNKTTRRGIAKILTHLYYPLFGLTNPSYLCDRPQDVQEQGPSTPFKTPVTVTDPMEWEPTSDFLRSPVGQANLILQHIVVLSSLNVAMFSVSFHASLPIVFYSLLCLF